jgi:class 3 adenylate cyclase
MREALHRHDGLIRDAVESSGGAVFRTVGDAFCCAFAVPVDALRALIDWSHDLLDNEERVLLRRLSVFVSGATLAAAEFPRARAKRSTRRT